MSKILQLRDTIVARIKALCAGADVAGHLGRFDLDELRAFMVKAPAIRVAVLGLEKSQPDPSEDTVNLVVRLGIYVATKDGPQAGDRTGAALGLVEAIVLLCDRQRWGLGSYVRPATDTAAQLLYSQGIRDAGVALWAIDLRQPVQLTSLSGDDGQLLTLFGGLAPNIGLGHQDDYVPLGQVQNGEVVGD